MRGEEAGTNHWGPVIQKGAWGPTTLHMFLSLRQLLMPQAAVLVLDYGFLDGHKLGAQADAQPLPILLVQDFPISQRNFERFQFQSFLPNVGMTQYDGKG